MITERKEEARQSLAITKKIVIDKDLHRWDQDVKGLEKQLKEQD